MRKSRVIRSAVYLSLALLAATASAQVTGSGSNGRVAKFTGSTSIGNSDIREDSGTQNIGVGINPFDALKDEIDALKSRLASGE